MTTTSRLTAASLPRTIGWVLLSLGLFSSPAMADSVSIQVESKKSNGDTWDGGGGAPDIAVCITGNQGKVCYPGNENQELSEAFCSDSFTCKFSNVILSSDFKIEVFDMDLGFDDAIGAGHCRTSQATCRVGQATVTISK